MKQKKQTAKNTDALFLTQSEQLLGWVYLALELLALPAGIALLGEYFGGFSQGVANFIYYCVNAVFCVLIFRPLLTESLLQAGDQVGRLIQIVLVGFLLLLGANQITSALAQLLIPQFVNANNQAVSAMVMENPFLLSIGLVMLVPVGEECLFRGLIFAGFHRQNRTGAYIASVLCFSLAHIVGYIGTSDPITLVLCFLQYVPPGIILAWSFEHTGSIFAPMLIHAAVNAGSILSLR